jgi:Flp pilus assembly protein TadG
MRWLVGRDARLSDERGGMAVLFGVLFAVVFAGFTALVVDSGAMFQERRELQNAADAGALAIAYDCARGDCGDTATTAASLANQNASDGFAEVTGVAIADERVTVDTRSLDPDGNNTFVQQLTGLLGLESTTVIATATASYEGSPSALETFPLTISACEFDNYLADSEGLDSGVEILIRIQGNTGPAEDCVAPAGGAVMEDGEELEGGFRWIDTGGDCRVASEVDGWVGSDGGTSLPHPNCSSILAALVGGPAVPLPIFDDVCKGGSPTTCASVGLDSNKGYHIFDYTGFRITGIRAPNLQEPTGFNCPPGINFCIRGFLESTVAEGPPGGVGVGGVSTVRLVE